MISATVPGLPVKVSGAGISAVAQARAVGPYHQLVEQAFLRQEELALATGGGSTKTD